MPFDDVWRIHSNDTRSPQLGGRVFFLLVYDVCEALGRAPCRACYPKFTTTRSGINKQDLENYPLEFPEILHVAPNQWVMKKCRSDGCWKNCLCCTFCAFFVALLRFLCHFPLWRQKSHICFVPSVSSVEHEKLQHLWLRMLWKFGCPRLTPTEIEGCFRSFLTPKFGKLLIFVIKP